MFGIIGESESKAFQQASDGCVGFTVCSCLGWYRVHSKPRSTTPSVHRAPKPNDIRQLLLHDGEQFGFLDLCPLRIQDQPVGEYRYDIGY